MSARRNTESVRRLRNVFVGDSVSVLIPRSAVIVHPHYLRTSRAACPTFAKAAFMTARESEITTIKREAYSLAWREFCALPSLSPDEKASGPKLLSSYVEIMAEAGERDPSKIARAAIAMLREYEQILRSKAHLAGNTALH